MKRLGAVGGLIGANVAVFVIMGLCGFSSDAPVRNLAADWLAMPGSLSIWVLKPWTCLTYMFTHTDPLHLLFNCLWIGWFGSLLRERARNCTLVLLYICGGLAGAAAYLLSSPMGGGRLLMGASASTLALIAAASILLGNLRLHMFFLGDVKLRWVGLFMILLAFLNLGGGGAHEGMAHVGGVAAGICFAFWPRLHCKIPKREKNRRRSRNVKNLMENRRDDQLRLDQLLDKISLSGFDSLSRKEKSELQKLSQRLEK